MEQLQVYSKPELVLISEKKKLRDYSPEQRLTQTANLVYKLLNLLGVNEGKTDHHVELARHVSDFYGHFTFEQIEKAFGLFIVGKFKAKPFQQLNAVVFGQVMQEFDEYQKEQTKVYRLNIQEFKNKAIPMETKDKDEFMEFAIKKAIEQFAKTGVIELASSKYDWLDSHNKLQDERSTEEWEKLKRTKYNSVQARLKVHYENEKAGTRDQKTEAKNTLKEIQENKSGKVIAQCKLELLEDYFTQQIKL